MDYDMLDQLIINLDDIFESALYKIESNKYHNLIVIDNIWHVLGTITDIDITKGLSANLSLTTRISRIMNRYCFALHFKKEADAKDIFNKHQHINLIPVVNDHGILLDIICRE